MNSFYASYAVFLIVLAAQKFAFTRGQTTLPPPTASCQDTIYTEISAFPHTPYTPPLINDDDHFTVNITMYLVDLLDLAEKDETVTTSWLTEAHWKDPRLQWNPRDHKMCSGISVPSSAIYLPDFRIFNDNSEDYPTKLFDNSFRALVNSDGDVEWWTAGIVTTGCNMNVKYFPFDTQICYIHVESASMLSTKMMLGSDGNSSLNMDNYGGNSQWNIVSIDVVPGTRLGGANIKFYMKLKRKPEYFLFNIVGPTILLSFMSVVVFVLPAHAEEKMGLSVTILLAFTVFMLTISNALPPSSDEISLLGLYTFAEMALSALAVLASVGILNIEHMPSHLEPSRGFRLFCDSLCRPLCMTNLFRHKLDDVRAASSNQVAPEKARAKKVENDHDQGHREANFKEEYTFYALVVDRALFWLFLFFQLVLMVAILAIFPAYQPDYQSTTHTVTTTTYHESRTVSSSSGGCCSPPFFDPQYYRGLPAILKLLEVILSLIAYLCVQCASYYCPLALQTTRPYFLFISFFAFISAAILWALLLFRAPFRILRCKCVNWPFMEMVFYVVVIILFVFGDIFISLYSSQCTNMDPYKAGAVFGWFALGAFIVDLIFLIRLFRASRNPPPYSVGGDSATAAPYSVGSDNRNPPPYSTTAAPADANPKY